ncbi:hypothetical protein [Clostridium sp.]|uniref:hypothetical protein n=1 Tax=Clostridium sp. TaxID=1506 RepID=UPI003F2C362E
MRKQLKHLLFVILPYAGILIWMCLVKYIDLSVIASIYLPILLVSILAIIREKYYIGYIFIASSEMGLLLEYIMSLNYDGKANMSGAFLNTTILFIGLVSGIILQLYMNKRHKAK